MKVILHKFHSGYHYELMRYPPRGAFFERQYHCNWSIPVDTAMKNYSCWRDYSRFELLHRGYDYIPLFKPSRVLIHSYGFPVMDPIAHVIDTDYFLYPFAADSAYLEKVKRLKKPLIPDHLKRIKESPRLQAAQKMLRSKYCKKILPWSQWCREMIFSLINDPVILKKVELLYPAMHLPNQEKIRHQGTRLIFVGGQRASFFSKRRS